MPFLIPTKAYLTSGTGYHRERLASFEAALRDAEIPMYNHVNVSSIFPPHAELVSKEEGIAMMEGCEGAILHGVMSRCETNEPNRRIAVACGLAIPKDRSKYGYISEHHAFGVKKKEVSDYAEDLAAEMLATALGTTFDPERDYNEQKNEYNLRGLITRSTFVAETAEGKKDQWVSVLAAVIFCEFKLYDPKTKKVLEL